MGSLEENPLAVKLLDNQLYIHICVFIFEILQKFSKNSAKIEVSHV